MKKEKPKIIVILGPTASGKTELAIKLAKKFKGEIISADSRQVFKGMDIGTAKPKDTNNIPHHLLDLIKPNQQFNVALFKRRALRAIKEIKKRKKIPFLVGGSGLYIQAVVENINFSKIPAQKELREKLEKKTEKELFDMYKKLDPKGAKLIEKGNKRRLIRAIEVSKATGKPYWEQRKKGEALFDVLEIGIKIPKQELRKRIKERTEKMIEQGLEKEVKKIIKKYGWIPPLHTIGYQEWKEYFSNDITKERVKEMIILHTGQFAKRQMTWFKRDKKILWVRDYTKAEKLIRAFLKKERAN